MVWTGRWLGASRCRVKGTALLAIQGVSRQPAHQNWANRELWSAAFADENIQSAAGSGDCAVAGFLTALLHAKSLEEILQFGNCLGWQNLRALDTVSGVSTLAETELLLKKLHPVTTPFLDQSWRATACAGVLERE